MKYILNEKFTLNEKFVLNEADEDNIEIDIDDNSTLANGGRNFAKELRDAGTDSQKISSILNDYYETWGEDSETVSQLGDGFVKELLNFGFTKDVNPFIYFLTGSQDVGKQGQNSPIRKFNLNYQTYGTIHNAYVDSDLDDADLKGTGAFGKNNLIFNAYLYNNKNIRDMEIYLDLQGRIKKSSSNADKKDLHKRAFFKDVNDPYGELKSPEDAKAEVAKSIGTKSEMRDFSQAELQQVSKPENIKAFIAWCYIRTGAKNVEKSKKVIDAAKTVGISDISSYSPPVGSYAAITDYLSNVKIDGDNAGKYAEAAAEMYTENKGK